MQKHALFSLHKQTELYCNNHNRTRFWKLETKNHVSSEHNNSRHNDRHETVKWRPRDTVWPRDTVRPRDTVPEKAFVEMSWGKRKDVESCVNVVASNVLCDSSKPTATSWQWHNVKSTNTLNDSVRHGSLRVYTTRFSLDDSVCHGSLPVYTTWFSL